MQRCTCPTMFLELWGKRPGGKFGWHCSAAEVRAYVDCVIAPPSIHVSAESSPWRSNKSKCWSTFHMLISLGCLHTQSRGFMNYFYLRLLSIYRFYFIFNYVFLCGSRCGYIIDRRPSTWKGLERASDPWSMSYRWLGCELSEVRLRTELGPLQKQYVLVTADPSFKTHSDIHIVK